MKIDTLMTEEPKVCTPGTSVAEAAHLMWEADCGMLPVVDHGELVGVVTDRDMYIAVATRNVLPSQLRVGAVARKEVVTCAPTDTVHDALATMKQARVRRLPVVDGGAVVGVVSMNDIVLAAASDRSIRKQEILETLASICAHTPPAPQIAAAA